MCGIVGIAGVMPVNQSIYDALTVLQHRGQGLNLGKVALYQLSYVRVSLTSVMPFKQRITTIMTTMGFAKSGVSRDVTACDRSPTGLAIPRFSDGISRLHQPRGTVTLVDMSEEAKAHEPVMIAAFEGWNDSVQQTFQVLQRTNDIGIAGQVLFLCCAVMLTQNDQFAT